MFVTLGIVDCKFINLNIPKSVDYMQRLIFLLITHADMHTHGKFTIVVLNDILDV